MSKKREHIIWSNMDLELEDWQDMFDDEDIVDEDEKYSRMMEMNYDYLQDERCNLNIQLSNPILAIADLGLWDGRRSAYKIIHSGNIRDILSAEGDYAKWYLDGNDIKGVDVHHDGTNYYTYREIKNMDNIHNLTDKLFQGEKTDSRLLSKYTNSIAPYIKNVYGW